MKSAIDYSSLFQGEGNYIETWESIYDDSLALPHNLLYILRHTVFLPHDFYDIITAYCLLPSALCRVIPYLFLQGQSGSGKSTVGKLFAYVHGISINSSSDTFAGIRNTLNTRRNGLAEIPDPENPGRTIYKNTERNTCMVWDDINANTFTSQPDLYNMFKYGYDRTTDKITISSKEVGENLEFRCFCPKIFSSVTPLHLDERFKELQRRMIVIPCKRVEELSDSRKAWLNINDSNWQDKLLNLDDYSWKGFNKVYADFWSLELGQSFVAARRIVSKITKGYTSQQRLISLDLLACGLAAGLWKDEEQAAWRVKQYWDWYKKETEVFAGLSSLLVKYIKQEQRNATNGNVPLEIYTAQLRIQVGRWVEQGFLYDKPPTKVIKETLADLGMRHKDGRWIKG